MKLRALGLFILIKALAITSLAFISHFKDQSFLKIFSRWDALWYARIAEHGYGFTKVHPDGRLLSDYAFFPFFPSLEHRIHQITHLDYIPSGVLLSALSSVVAALFIFLIVKEIRNESAALVAVTIWAALPMGIVQSLAYSESLFTAFAAGAIYLTIKQRFINAAFLAFGAGLTRPTGLAVAAAVSIPAILYWWRNKSSVNALLAIFIAPIGWFAYILWVGHKTGSLFGYFQVTKGWGNHIDGGIAFIKWIGHQFSSNPFAGILLLLGVAGLIALVVWSIHEKLPQSILIYNVTLLVIALATSGYFGSKPRYLLPAFGLLIAPAIWVSKKRPSTQLIVLFGLALSAFIYGGLWLTGSGPL